MELFFDTETSGFINKNLPIDDPRQSWIMQIAFILGDESRTYVEFSSLIEANGRTCHPKAQEVHKISVEECNVGGMNGTDIVGIFADALFKSDLLVAHNISFDMTFVRHLIYKSNLVHVGEELMSRPLFCTMKSSTNLCKLPGHFGNYKWPKLTELYKFLFDEEFECAHDALADVKATRRCYYKLREIL